MTKVRITIPKFWRVDSYENTLLRIKFTFLVKIHLMSKRFTTVSDSYDTMIVAEILQTNLTKHKET